MVAPLQVSLAAHCVVVVHAGSVFPAHGPQPGVLPKGAGQAVAQREGDAAEYRLAEAGKTVGQERIRQAVHVGDARVGAREAVVLGCQPVRAWDLLEFLCRRWQGTCLVAGAAALGHMPGQALGQQGATRGVHWSERWAHHRRVHRRSSEARPQALAVIHE